ncbi:MAG: hypothetical protein WC587_02510 [Candidatus Paceibacterota bacterium]
MEENNLKSFLEEHFIYEVNMFCTSLESIIAFKGQNNFWINNLALENFLLHFRNIIEFLYFDKKCSDDARAKEFISSDNWSLLKKSYSDETKKLYIRACKEISHLTYSRFYGTPPEKQWDLSKIFKETTKEVKNFLNYLPDNLCIKVSIRNELENRINKL